MRLYYSLAVFNIINLTGCIYSRICTSRNLTSMVTVATGKILDRFIPVGFWIRASQQSGLIEVGKYGENLPFIFWTDPVPIPVKYYSFSSWGTAVCQWMFKCIPDPLAMASKTMTNTTGYNKMYK